MEILCFSSHENFILIRRSHSDQILFFFHERKLRLPSSCEMREWRKFRETFKAIMITGNSLLATYVRVTVKIRRVALLGKEIQTQNHG